jgi:EAL and modified HD-GYP domain-containing signal transduction protein
MRRTHIARQPVLKADGDLFGYRLSVRGDDGEAVAIPDADQAQALLRTLTDNSFLRMLGDRPTFLDLPPDIVHQPLREFLPLSGAILCLRISAGVDEEWRDAALAAREQGFGLAVAPLDDAGGPGHITIAVDYRIGEPQRPPDHPAGDPAQLLAEGVHTPQDFEAARDNGYNLFHGQFFAQPTLFTSDNLTPKQSTLLHLYQQLAGEADFDAVEDTFRRNPELSLQLLQLINSAAFQRGGSVDSIRQALVMLGSLQLRRWVGLLLFSEGEDSALNNPLMPEANLRGRIMELAAREAASAEDAEADWSGSAYITGLLQVIQALLGRPMRVLVEDLGLRDEVARALLEGAGPLGELLQAVDRLRRQQPLPDTVSVGRSQLPAERLLALEEQAQRET